MKVQEFTLSVVVPLKPNGETYGDHELLSCSGRFSDMQPHPVISLLKSEVRDAYVSEGFDFEMQSSLAGKAFLALGRYERKAKNYWQSVKEYSLENLQRVFVVQSELLNEKAVEEKVADEKPLG